MTSKTREWVRWSTISRSSFAALTASALSVGAVSLGTASLGMVGCAGKTPDAAEPLRVVQQARSFSGADGMRVEAVDFADDTSLVRVSNLQSELTGKVFSYQRVQNGDRLEYRTKWHGDDLYALVKERDGRWMAYVSRQTGKDEVFVQSFPDKTGEQRISVSGGVNPVWSPDGRRLYFQSGGSMMAADIKPGSRLEHDAPRLLFAMANPDGTSRHQFDVHPDGKRFLMRGVGAPPGSVRLNIILNWQSLLKK